MNILTFKGYEGTAELDMERGVCRGKILFIEDLVTYEADSPSQLQAVFEEAVGDYLETCQRLGKEPNKPLRGQFNVRVPPAVHRAAWLRAVTDQVSLNEVVVRAMDCYLNVRADVMVNVKVTSEDSSLDLRTVLASTAGVAEWSSQRVN
ncbi:type II toxin-antitoxin system HicB family antitoxin [Rhodanobacter sp. MP1X3]|uniref:type II toxin-antitoxin system HicB family antitoxin n=1 Tax=Rhodanobacter sp. MP1X3 TaxID=2723086 RepID=UPI001616BA81|nr:type II toxin-antitoxin system HicB family antitoxin [Rhodanobacter sp. MP1X3]MBB6243092.1 putative HicB family RNase H-like nuclease [Rhodanobacter sp. MP1X3]